MFGPRYPKINTMFMRDEGNHVIPGEWAEPEFGYLKDLPWVWKEKVDGTNIRLHWNGSRMTIGGKEDDAMLPSRLVATLGALADPERWKSITDSDDVTVYGEGYGKGIGPGGKYRADLAMIVFDVRVGPWWLKDEDVCDVAGKLGLEIVPLFGSFGLEKAWQIVQSDGMRSYWKGAAPEGLVGRPEVPLVNRSGERIITKIKRRDWDDLQRAQAAKEKA